MQRIKTVLVALMVLLPASLLVIGCQPDASELIAKGKGAHERGDYDEAIENYNAALEQSPDNIDAMVGIADAYLAQGKVDEAITQYLDSIDKAKSEGQKNTIKQLMGAAYLAKAENLWKKGAYRGDPKVAEKIEETALKATEGTEKPVRDKAYKLLLALYDYQFERYRGEYASADEGDKAEMRQRELDLIDKVFSTVRPSKEFKKRLRDRMKELTEQAFLEKANKVFDEKVKPVLAKDPNITLTKDRVAVIVAIPLADETIAKLDNEEFMAQENAMNMIMTPYYAVAKEQTVEVVEIIVAGMLGQDKLEQSILPSRVETYTVDKEEFFEDPEDGNKRKVRVVGSMSLEEIRELAFDYQLYLETEGKLEKNGNGKKDAGEKAKDDGAGTKEEDGKEGNAEPAGDDKAGDGEAANDGADGEKPTEGETDGDGN